MKLKGLPGTVVTLAAAGRYCQLELQIFEVNAAVPRSSSDVSIRDAVADTNNHLRNVIRIDLICKRPKQCLPIESAESQLPWRALVR
jgi:hypothetical protein